MYNNHFVIAYGQKLLMLGIHEHRENLRSESIWEDYFVMAKKLFVKEYTEKKKNVKWFRVLIVILQTVPVLNL